MTIQIRKYQMVILVTGFEKFEFPAFFKIVNNVIVFKDITLSEN